MNRFLEGKTGLLLLFLPLVAIFSKNPLINVALKNYGSCVYGTLTERKIRQQRHGSTTIIYEFAYNEKTYEGASDIVDPEFKRKGEKICILYLSYFPFVNRPKSFFGEDLICNCNK